MGFEPTERSLATPGLDLWVYSQPYEGDEQEGDVYYVTLCGGGVITRIAVADVSGHGASVAEFSSSLSEHFYATTSIRKVRKSWSNNSTGNSAPWRRCVDSRQRARNYISCIEGSTVGFQRWTSSTAAIPDVNREWMALPQQSPERNDSPGNLPLGLDDETRDSSAELTLEPGDHVLFYTDALIEAADSSGRLLGVTGLLDIVRG